MMMKRLLTILFICIAAKGFSTAYYFSSYRGDDSRSATQAKSPATPWLSLAKLDSIFPFLNTGDSLLLERGSKWVGTIRIRRSGGSTSSRIVLADFTHTATTSNAKPIITSLITLGSWSRPDATNKPNLWLSGTVLSVAPSIVVQSNKVLPLGRYPNDLGPSNNRGYLTVNGVINFTETITRSDGTKYQQTTTNGFTDPELPTSPSWVGAEVVVRLRRWKLDRCVVDSHKSNSGGGSRIRFTPYEKGASMDYPKQVNGYWFQDHINTLDQEGEWYFDPVAKKTYVYHVGGTAPSGVQVASINDLITSSGYSYFKIKNIQFIGANRYGMSLNSVNNGGLVVEGCVVNFSGVAGISSSSTGNGQFNFDTVMNSLNAGMDLGITRGKIERCYVKNSGAIAGMGNSGSSSYKGIGFGGSGNLVQYNRVDSSGYMGIHFYGGDSQTVQYNYVTYHNFAKDDGGGIYTRGDFDDPISHWKNRKILNNIVGYGVAVPEGTTGTQRSAVNIYLDDNAEKVLVEGNTAFKGSRGIYFHNTQYDTARNNLAFDNRENMMFQRDGIGSAFVNNRIVSNIFYAKKKSSTTAESNQYALNNNLLNNNLDIIPTYGSFDSNYYARPVAPTGALHVPISPWDYTLKMWQDSFPPYDIHSKTATPITYSNTDPTNQDTSLLFLINPKETTTRFNLNMKHWKDITGKKYLYDTINIRPYGSALLFRDTGIVTDISTPPNKAPTVTITSPIGNAVYTSPASIPLTANASDPDGSITKVEFYVNNSLIRTENLAPYSWSGWINVLPGTYYVIAKAYDNATPALVTTSAQVQVTVVAPPNQIPVVTLTSPTDSARYTSPATVRLTATASDPDGIIAKVDFYQGSTLIKTDNAAPFDTTWTSVAAGNYSVTAKATDNKGAVSSSNSAFIIVTNTPLPPSVTLTSPSAGATYTSPASIPLAATATDQDGTITKVEFYTTGSSTPIAIRTAPPYSLSWTNVGAGTYTIYAKAYDSQGLTNVSGQVAVYVNLPVTNAPPTVDLTSPVNGDQFTSPATVSLTANSFDADGTVTYVEFLNGTTVIKRDSTNPYSFSWTNVAAGNYNITAKAVDNLGLTSTSNVAAISVKAPLTYPVVSIISPTPNQTYTAPATVRIFVNASDPDGIQKVEFYNGNTLLHTETVADYLWDWPNVPAGTYNITVKAYDNLGYTTTTASISITVKSTTVNKKPVVNITAPADGATYATPATIVINATASDSDGTVKRVEFFSGSNLIGTDTSSPYSATWTNAPAGTYNITAKATDNSGATTVSTGINVFVYTPDIAPTVSITAPANNNTYTAPATVVVNATAADADGSISVVDFYKNDVLICSDSVSPYSCDMSPLSEGSYIFVAKATDDKGVPATSNPISITVNPVVANQLPVTSLTSPTSGATYVQPDSVILIASATDADGTIARVIFYDGSNQLFVDDTAPYSYTWKDAAVGTHTIHVEATDDQGATSSTVDAPTQITVNEPPVGNRPPVISLTTPGDGATYNYAPTSVVMGATASDPDGTVSKVQFYNGTQLLYTDYTKPYGYTWTSVRKGIYQVTAKATDNSGRTASQTVEISVNSGNKTVISVNTTQTAIVK